LLPDWATPSAEEVSTVPTGRGVPQSEAGDGQAESSDEGVSDEYVGEKDRALPTPISPQHWRAAKMAMGRAAGSGGSGRRDAIKNAARTYVKARGGAKSAARSASTGRSATAALGGLLSSIASRGLNATLTAYGLQAAIGKGAATVFAAIMNAIAPTGASRDHAVARDAIGRALDDIYERFVAADGDVSHLDAMTASDVATAVEAAVIACINSKWVEELGIRIEQRAVSETEAVRLERDLKAFVQESVVLDLAGRNILEIDWEGQGLGLIQTVYEKAYSIMGEG
jgi:hypothetical protein